MKPLTPPDNTDSYVAIMGLGASVWRFLAGDGDEMFERFGFLRVECVCVCVCVCVCEDRE